MHLRARLDDLADGLQYLVRILFTSRDQVNHWCFNRKLSKAQVERFNSEHRERLIAKTDLSKVASTLPGSDLMHEDEHDTMA